MGVEHRRAARRAPPPARTRYGDGVRPRSRPASLIPRPAGLVPRRRRRPTRLPRASGPPVGRRRRAARIGPDSRHRGSRAAPPAQRHAGRGRRTRRPHPPRDARASQHQGRRLRWRSRTRCARYTGPRTGRAGLRAEPCAKRCRDRERTDDLRRGDGTVARLPRPERVRSSKPAPPSRSTCCVTARSAGKEREPARRHPSSYTSDMPWTPARLAQRVERVGQTWLVTTIASTSARSQLPVSAETLLGVERRLRAKLDAMRHADRRLRKLDPARRRVTSASGPSECLGCTAPARTHCRGARCRQALAVGERRQPASTTRPIGHHLAPRSVPTR